MFINGQLEALAEGPLSSHVVLYELEPEIEYEILVRLVYGYAWQRAVSLGLGSISFALGRCRFPFWETAGITRATPLRDPAVLCM